MKPEQSSRKHIVLCAAGMLAAVMLLILPGYVSALEGLPGSTWGALTYSNNDLSGSSGMGWINQGIDWFTLPGGFTVNTYGEYRYRARDKNNDYYNAQGPAIGLELKKSFFRLGADYYEQRFPKLGQTSYNREIYLNGYYGWNAAALFTAPAPAGPATKLPGAIWFNSTYDANGLTGSGVMGWINQGIDLWTFSNKSAIAAYAEYRYRTRTKEKQYYNAEGPAVGVEYKQSAVHVGADYYWENDPDLPGRTDYLEVYLNWFIDWDLKHPL